ncbi:MAG: 6,7-dimethyl-8-ribityllumazine synthase, partial [Bacteroidales bacterium]|nr:6,7-dimethyl-8-ribityllumazine synthase [Bacteroidales bacterium]
MATSLKNLSEYDSKSVPNASELSIGIVVAEWNMDVNNKLLQGAIEALQKHGVAEKNIIVNYVPGSFELTYGARILAENYDVDAIIVIGTVIQGETPHFTYICQSVSYGITELNLSYDLPFIFGVLTVNTKEQAMDRAG